MSIVHGEEGRHESKHGEGEVVDRREEEANEERIKHNYENFREALSENERSSNDEMQLTLQNIGENVLSSQAEVRISSEYGVVEMNDLGVYDSADAPISTSVSSSGYGELRLMTARRFHAETNNSPSLRERCRKNKLRLTAGLVAGAAILGVGTSLAAFLLGMFKAANPPKDPGKPEPNPDLPPEFPTTMKEIVEAWNAMPEELFWKAVIQWLKETEPSPSTPVQLDFIRFARAISTRSGEYSDIFIDGTIKSLLATWERASVTSDGLPLSDEGELARDVGLYETVSTLADNAEPPKELPRFWKLLLLECVLASIAQLPHITDNEMEAKFEKIGEWISFRRNASSRLSLSSLAGKGENLARFTVTGLTPGNYQVSGTWPVNSANAKDAPYLILDKIGGSELIAISVDQTQPTDDFAEAGRAWKKLTVVKVPEKSFVLEINDKFFVGENVYANAVHAKRTVKIDDKTRT